VNGALAWVSLGLILMQAGCTAPRGYIRDCPSMPVKGWHELFANDLFARLDKTRERPFESVLGTSRMFLADSSFNYETLVTFDFSHPAMAQGRPDERCVRDVRLLVHEPLEGIRAETLAAFVAFLRSKGVPAELARAVEAARGKNAAFATLGGLPGGGALSAGFVEQGARGRFFEVEVRSPPEQAR